MVNCFKNTNISLKFLEVSVHCLHLSLKDIIAALVSSIAINCRLLSFCRQSSVYSLGRVLWDLRYIEQKLKSYFKLHQPLTIQKHVHSLRLQIRKSNLRALSFLRAFIFLCAFVFSPALRALIFLHALRAFIYLRVFIFCVPYVPYVPSSFCVPNVVSFFTCITCLHFLRALHVFIFFTCLHIFTCLTCLHFFPFPFFIYVVSLF